MIEAGTGSLRGPHTAELSSSSDGGHRLGQLRPRVSWEASGLCLQSACEQTDSSLCDVGILIHMPVLHVGEGEREPGGERRRQREREGGRVELGREVAGAGLWGLELWK